MDKRCIFHYPGLIEQDPALGSEVRPRAMLQAFKSIGYQVDAVIGYSAERKKKIQEIKRNIRAGVKYDFVYSESRNIPVALADEDHIPRHPFLDFSFLRFCKKSGIPIGFFLRDIHWKFPFFNDLVFWKRITEKVLFSYDLWNYRRLVDCFYVASDRIRQYCLSDYELYELPPGSPVIEGVQKERGERIPEKGRIRIFYVGNVTGIADMTPLFDVVRRTKEAELTICTPRAQWEKYVMSHGENDCERIKIVHKKSDELGPYYKWCDVAALYVAQSSYGSIAVPIKIMEYVGYGVPIVAASGSPAADFIKDHDLGWVIDRDDDDLRALLEHLAEHPEEVREKTGHVLEAIRENTWECRAKQVRKDLCGT